MPNSEGALTGIDLFAGAGGFSLAAQNAGVHVLAAIENNAHACKSYRSNLIEGKKQSPKLYEKDILKLEPDTLLKEIGIKAGECDIVMGGPPCQGFSVHRINDQGVDDPRNALLMRYFHFVKAIQPRVFIVENVPGLLWKRHAKYLTRFYEIAKEQGYEVFTPQVLNAKDFGVPQNRKRVFILGVRDDIEWLTQWPPLPAYFSPQSPEVNDKKCPAWKTAALVFQTPLAKGDVNAVHMNHSKELIEVFRSTPKNGGSRSQSNRKLPCHKKHDGHKDVYGRINPDVPGPTMTTACINPSKGRFVHPTEHHGITVRHAARFQTFPETFVFEGGLIAAGQQIGNAVPILLGEAVINSIKDGLTRQVAQSGKDTSRTKFKTPQLTAK